MVVFADGVQPSRLPGGAPWNLGPPDGGQAYGGQFAPSLAPGQVLDLYWSYSVSLHADGLAADRAGPPACIAWFPQVNCAPAATGHELAFASFNVFGESRVQSQANTSFISDFDSFALRTSGAAGNAETLDQSGIVHLQLTGLQSPVTVPNSYFFYYWVWTDSNPIAPVPEPSTYALMLAGLLFLGWRRHTSR